MTTIIMTSPRSPGQIEFTYDDLGYLIGLTITESLTKQQYAFLYSNLPWHKDHLSYLIGLAPHATFVEKTLVVTFEMFWNKYNDKDRSSKIKTEKAWNKLDQATQIKAYLHIPKYEKSRGSAEKKYATTYLADQLWNN